MPSVRGAGALKPDALPVRDSPRPPEQRFAARHGAAAEQRDQAGDRMIDAPSLPSGLASRSIIDSRPHLLPERNPPRSIAPGWIVSYSFSCRKHGVNQPQRARCHPSACPE